MRIHVLENVRTAIDPNFTSQLLAHFAPQGIAGELQEFHAAAWRSPPFAVAVIVQHLDNEQAPVATSNSDGDQTDVLRGAPSRAIARLSTSFDIGSDHKKWSSRIRGKSPNIQFRHHRHMVGRLVPATRFFVDATGDEPVGRLG